MANLMAYPLLVVEDSDEDFEILQWALKKLSINTPVYRCVDGDDALDFLHNRGQYSEPAKAPRPTIILLDLQLTATDGYEVLEQIKQDESLKNIPVLLMSAHRNLPHMSELAGADGYISKPFMIDELLLTIEAALKQYAPARR